MTTLLAHLEAENAERQEWLDAGPDRWISMVVTDVEFWAEMGITTVEEYEREQMNQGYSDYHKSVLGFRPSTRASDMTKEELDSEYAYLNREAEAEEARDAAFVQGFEERVLEVIESGAGDRATALRWIADAEEEMEDFGMLCFKLHLPYSYEKDFKEAFA